MVGLVTSKSKLVTFPLGSAGRKYRLIEFMLYVVLVTTLSQVCSWELSFSSFEIDVPVGRDMIEK